MAKEQAEQAKKRGARVPKGAQKDKNGQKMTRGPKSHKKKAQNTTVKGPKESQDEGPAYVARHDDQNNHTSAKMCRTGPK